MANILIAEDDPDIRKVVAHLLASEGHMVSEVADGAEVLECLRWNAPDLLILDIMMPRLDGYGVLENMTESGAADTTRVLMLTAKAAERDFAQSLTLGASRHMTKPFDPDELLQAVTDLLEFTADEVKSLREQEHARATLLSQLESLLEG